MELTQKKKLFDVLDNMRVAFPDFADELGSEYTDETILVRKAGPSETLEVQPIVQNATTGKDEGIIIGDITTLAVDSYREVVLPEGMNPTRYAKNNVVLRAHNYTDFLPHGENAWLKFYPKSAPTRVRAATKYYLDDDYGLKVYNYRAAKRPLGYSIGFIPTQETWREMEDWQDELEKWQDRFSKHTGGSVARADMPVPELIYLNWILLEYSDVVVPANPDTVALYVAKGLIEPGEADELIIESTKPDATSKGVDDAAVLLNAERIDEMSVVLGDLATRVKDKESGEAISLAVATAMQGEGRDVATAVKAAMEHESALNEIIIPEMTALKDFSISSIVRKMQGKLE